MKTKKIKIWLIFACFLTFISASFLFLFFDDNITLAKYNMIIKKLKNYSKNHVGGIVYNNTNKIIEITDYKYIHKLPPGSSSRDIGIFDADSIIVNEPMYFEDKLYSNGVLRFCDYSRLKITEVDDVPEIKAKNTWVCRLLNDFNFCNSIKEAFR